MQSYKLLFDPIDILFLSVTRMVFCFLLKVTAMLNFRVANLDNMNEFTGNGLRTSKRISQQIFFILISDYKIQNKRWQILRNCSRGSWQRRYLGLSVNTFATTHFLSVTVFEPGVGQRRCTALHHTEAASYWQHLKTPLSSQHSQHWFLDFCAIWYSALY